VGLLSIFHIYFIFSSREDPLEIKKNDLQERKRWGPLVGTHEERRRHIDIEKDGGCDVAKYLHSI
jgi:hypothetical protein